MIIRICETQIYPQEIKIESESEPDVLHTVISATIFNDPICTCAGWRFRSTCKHVKKVLESQCDWIDGRDNSDITICPKCGSKAIDFELEPE